MLGRWNPRAVLRKGTCPEIRTNNLTCLERVMRLDVNKLSSAVRLALSLGAVASTGAVTALAQDTAAQNSKGQSLETIVVTGSNIRRVDIETASPAVTINRAQ